MTKTDREKALEALKLGKMAKTAAQKELMILRFKKLHAGAELPAQRGEK